MNPPHTQANNNNNDANDHDTAHGSSALSLVMAALSEASGSNETESSTGDHGQDPSVDSTSNESASTMSKNKGGDVAHSNTNGNTNVSARRGSYTNKKPIDDDSDDETVSSSTASSSSSATSSALNAQDVSLEIAK